MALELVCGADFLHNLCRAGPVDLKGLLGLGGAGVRLKKLREIGPKIFSSNCLQVPSPLPHLESAAPHYLSGSHSAVHPRYSGKFSLIPEYPLRRGITYSRSLPAHLSAV